jgi:hypothetical protein
MDDKFKPLEEQEVLSLKEADKILLSQLMFTPSQLIAQIKFVLNRHAGNRTNENLERWLSEGVDCATLKFGSKGWQQGKVRIKLAIEFCPDEPEIAETTQPESPLDDLRQMINKETPQ